MFKNTYPFFVRFVDGGDNESVGDTDTEGAAEDKSVPTPNAMPKRTTVTVTKDTGADTKAADSPDEDKEWGESKGRGGKRQVLEDLAREREKRHELEGKFKALTAEYEKATAENKDTIGRISALEGELHSQHIESALHQFNLPAVMAQYVTGNTKDEVIESAKELAKNIGSFTGVDPTQGKGTTAKPTTLAEAISAHYQ